MRENFLELIEDEDRPNNRRASFVDEPEPGIVEEKPKVRRLTAKFRKVALPAPVKFLTQCLNHLLAGRSRLVIVTQANSHRPKRGVAEPRNQSSLDE